MARSRPNNRTPEVVLKDVEALRLAADGLTFEQIGVALGENKGSSYRRVHRTLDRVQTDAVETYREREHAVLMAARARLVEVMYAKHVHVSDGRIVRDDDGNAILDDGPAIAAAQALVRNVDRVCKLFGLDAPTRLEVSDALTAEIEQLAADIAATDRSVDTESAGSASGPAGS